ncbi:pimeloyl-ACP methyl ester carboxylesterase [Amycolatopsis lexingtonensis]|uniref:Pimeloyl-ACP methyl ester carboxylesterase n=1 Tax=Amycolatopsis lexingtonensis TaxID=218822 RepID=A0ABR9IEW9_9PSEU|nr:alpha/beta hydrolase [Amycolatopsis lexingtonensis]MBE1501715.1 pimeloyl-ACP methyl ester carboxylesterase [Amycolatopsis lexingtonensis]
MISRRRFGQAFAAGLAATSLAACSSPAAPAAPAAATPPDLRAGSGEHTSLGEVKHADAGVLNMAYYESGPATGQPVVLLHGWPYDPYSYVDVAPILAAAGYRVIIPFLRGYGPTVFKSAATVRNGQQTAVALDVVALLDALKIDKAVFGGYDWGGRTVDIIAALWPERCKSIVAVSGYIVTNLAANQKPLAPQAELGWWYQYYFATERGRAGYAANRHDFNKLIWKTASPAWHFDDATYDRSAAAFDNPDHVAIVIHNYRWRLSLAPGEPQYEAYEQKLAAGATIGVPSITIGSDFDGAAKDGAAYRAKFTGKYEHRVFDGIGHNVPQEAPKPFAQAIMDADRM